MKIEKIIKTLDDIAGEEASNTNGKRMMACIAAMQELTKQIPKDVLDQHNDEYFTGKCPSCRSTIADMAGPAFCHCCGQALKWAD